jgi:ApaG protein
MSNTVTRGLRIEVSPRYLPMQSDPAARRWVFAYHIRILNEGHETLQLISRHWIITNGDGRVEEVKGMGLVGHQPRLEPGEEFEYTSGCPLDTPVGTMHGSFKALLANGETFDAAIQPFRLAIPSALN